MSTASVLDREIREQPAVLARLLDQGWWGVTRAAERIRAAAPDWALIAARGTSDNAALYAQYLLGAYNQLGVSLALPSLFTLYGAPPRLGRALVIGISQSGQSPDVVSVIAEGRRQGAVTLAITNDAASPLANAAELTIPLIAGDERAVAASKTYTAELLAIAMLSAALDRDHDRWIGLQFAPEALAMALDGCSAALPGAGRFRDAERFLVLGRGFNYCTAYELALKLEETSYVLAEPYSTADLMHGPIALVDRGFPVILVAPSGRASDSAAPLLDLLVKRRARIIGISDRADVLAHAEVGLPLPAGVPEWLSPLIAIGPAQRWAHALAAAKQIDADAPRGLSKVTLTH